MTTALMRQPRWIKLVRREPVGNPGVERVLGSLRHENFFEAIWHYEQAQEHEKRIIRTILAHAI